MRKPKHEGVLPDPGALRRRLRCFWEEYEWSIVGAMALLALVLGQIGFMRHLAAGGETYSALDVFYLALQLFMLESGAVHGHVPVELHVARLLAPMVLGYTAVKALLVVFRDQFQLYRVRFLKNHVIVCGLGRKGALLVKAFAEKGFRVVAIEEDAVNGLIEQSRAHGAIVLLGDGADAELLRLARLRSARYLVAACGDDGTNAEIAILARELVKDRQGSGLTCFVHLAELDLMGLLREREIATQRADAFRLELFNVYHSAARALLSAHPPFAAGASVHVAVIGLTKTGTSLIVRLAKLWHTLYGREGRKLRLTVVDAAAAQKARLLLDCHPPLGRICDLTVYALDSQSADFMQAGFLDDGRGVPVTAVYVCLGNDAQGLSTALMLRQRLRGRRVPIVVTTHHETGLGALLRGEGGREGGAGGLQAFGLLDHACRAELLLDGTHEILARAAHEEWMREQRARGVTPANDPAMVAWDQLPETLKNSNRRQADHIGVKLRAVGCDIQPLNDWDTELFEFSPEEIERMAEMEHARWVEERVQDGWVQGPTRDIAKKISPYLVPWKDLDERTKELDRNAARNLPASLAQAGFQIYRVMSR